MFQKLLALDNLHRLKRILNMHANP